MCVEVIVCYIRVVFLRHGVFSLHTVQILSRLVQQPQRLREKNYTFLEKRQKTAFSTKYLSMYKIDRNHNFNAGRQMHADYKTQINFAIIKGTLPW